MPEDTTKFKTNNKISDFWTFIHIIIAGFLAVLIPVRWIAYFIIIGFELIEKYILEAGLFPNPYKELEGPRNRLADIIITLLSWEIVSLYV